MAEIRIDPLTGDFIVVNDKRMDRPVITTQAKVQPECPFCAKSSKRHPGLPLEYEALAVDNLYPPLVLEPQVGNQVEKIQKDEVFISQPNLGKCKVLLYSSEHNLEFYDQSDELTTKIMKLWQKQFLELQKNELLKYIFIFENRGSAVGVTIPHPHGQLYALPVIPPIIKQILKQFKKYNKEHNTCLLCAILSEELASNIRIIEQNEFFVAFVPYYAKMLYEVHIVPRIHHSNIGELTFQELQAFGIIIKSIRKKYDLLFKEKKASFMMMLFNEPVNSSKKIFHMYLQFVCLDRDNYNFKYRASMETGLYFWTNDSSPERIAEEFKKL